MRKRMYCEVLVWPAVCLLLLVASSLAYDIQANRGHDNTARLVPNQNSACDSTLVLTGTSGDIVSYNHPGQYENNLNCSWLITADSVPSFNNSVVHLTFEAFDVESSTNCEYDYLTIYDGSSDSSSVLKTLCGSTRPQPILATGLQVYARFITDPSGTSTGFHITWKVVEEASETITNQNEACINPPLTLSGEKGHIVSWNYPQNYANNLRCAWKISADANANFENTAIELDVQSFELEGGNSCQFDYIEIYDGSLDSPVIGRYCGTNIPQKLLLSGTEMYMTFTTDSSTTRPGFWISWKTVDVSNIISQNAACLNESRPLILTGDHGEIVSWNYPHGYLGNLSCAWKIQADSAFSQGVVKITFDDFRLVADTKCLKHNLTIHDGLSENSFILGQFCGFNIPSAVFASGKDMYLSFQGSGQLSTSTVLYGFRLLWNISEAENTTAIANHTAACINPPLEVSETEGDIFSWNYPGHYTNNLRCSWLITGVPVINADDVVRLRFLDFETESPCTRDYLTIYAKRENDLPDKELGKFCGSSLPPNVVSDSNKMLVTFFSDVTETKRGFHLRWEMVDKSFVIEDQNSACTNPPLLLTGSSNGEIVSYNYPNNYDNNQNCAWKVTATNNNNFQNAGIELTAERFEVELNSQCSFDYLRIYEGGSAESPMIGQYCGNTFPNSLVLYSTEIYLTFRSDGSGTYTGFRLFWNVTDTDLLSNQNGACRNNSKPLVLMGTSGEITSWNFPSPYASNLNCAWQIIADTNSVQAAVKISIETLEIDDDVKCAKDVVIIHDGPTTDYPVLEHFCGNVSLPRSIVSSGKQMYVTFLSGLHIGNTHHGFRMTWNISEPADPISVTANHTAACGAEPLELTGENGEIFSWNYPQSYANNLRCVWQITASDDTKVIRLIFVDFDVESPCTTDALTIYNYNTTTQESEEVNKFCGNAKPRNVIGKSHVVILKFETDHTVVKRGFHIDWDSVNELDFTIPPYNGECGVPQIPIKPGNGRVVGGQAATPGSWPWQVDIQRASGGHNCGASLIHPQWMLSAAHCFRDASPASWRAVVGKFNKHTVDETEQKLFLEKVFIHADYGGSGSGGYDFAMLKLVTPAETNGIVLPVCLPAKDSVVPNGTMCYTTGWGATHGTGSDDVLKQAMVPIVDRVTCNKPELYNNGITDSMVCAGYVELGGHDSCQGDSGGPFVCYRKNEDGSESNAFELSGVVSWGSGCARPNKPGIYSRTAAVIDWIEELMKFE